MTPFVPFPSFSLFLLLIFKDSVLFPSPSCFSVPYQFSYLCSLRKSVSSSTLIHLKLNTLFIFLSIFIYNKLLPRESPNKTHRRKIIKVKDLKKIVQVYALHWLPLASSPLRNVNSWTPFSHPNQCLIKYYLCQHLNKGIPFPKQLIPWWLTWYRICL